MLSMPTFGYDPNATSCEEAASGRNVPGDIDESPPAVSLIVHNDFECFPFTDDEPGWIKAVRKLRAMAALSTDPKEWRINRYAYWDAGQLGDLVRMYHICYASDLPPMSLAEGALDDAANSAGNEEEQATAAAAEEEEEA